MKKVSTIGLDLAKNVFQAHGADASAHVSTRLRAIAIQKIFLAPKRASTHVANFSWRMPRV